MNAVLSEQQIALLGRGFDPEPQRSSSINKICYIDPQFLAVEKEQIFQKSWQFVCHEEKLKKIGDYITVDVQGQSILVVRAENGELNAFYNVCKHRAHELLQGEANHLPLSRLGVQARRFVAQGPKKSVSGKL